MSTPYAQNDRFKYLELSVPSESPHVVIVSLDRPQKRNAISALMWKEIGMAFSILGRTGDDCRCVIVAGAGKDFTAGIDISDPSILLSNDPAEAGDTARKGLSFLPKILEMQRCLTMIERCPIPVIAAIHGNCIGAGIDLVSCCDIRLSQVGAKFSVREVRLGLAADVGTLQRLPRIIGNDSRVRELCYTGELFDHSEALRIGFVSRVCHDVLKDAIDLACLIATNSPVAVAGTKLSLVYSRDHTVADGLKHVASHNALALMTDDIPAAFAAASKKTPATFAPMVASSRL